MSRVGKYPVNVPSDVTVAINGQEIKVKGMMGELSYTAPACIKVTFADQKLHVEPQSKEKDGAYWGTVRSLLNGMVTLLKIWNWSASVLKRRLPVIT